MIVKTDAMPEWTEQVAKSAARHAEQQARETHKWQVMAGTPSPIERALYAAIVHLLPEYLDAGLELNGWVEQNLTIHDLTEYVAHNVAVGGRGFPVGIVAREVKIGGYRVDFLIAVPTSRCLPTSRVSCIAVECDGHEFHDRTKEQASADRSRDRTLQAANVRVLRFTGSDIWRDPVGCAKEVLDQALHEHWFGTGSGDAILPRNAEDAA